MVEYHCSNRDKRETIFDNELATALRFLLNKNQSTEVLLGVTTDIENHSVAGFIEASSYLGEKSVSKIILAQAAFFVFPATGTGIVSPDLGLHPHNRFDHRWKPELIVIVRNQS